MRVGLWLVLGCLPALGLAGCGSSTPTNEISFVSPQLPSGALTGTQSTTPEGGSFSVGGNALTCSGAYFGVNRQPTVNATMICSDSRTGTLAMSGTSGNDAHGTFKLSDGTQGQVLVKSR